MLFFWQSPCLTVHSTYADSEKNRNNSREATWELQRKAFPDSPCWMNWTVLFGRAAATWDRRGFFYFFCPLQYLNRVCEHTGNLNHVVPKSLPQASWSPDHRAFVKHWWNDEFMKCLSFTKGSSSGPIIFSGCWGRLWWGYFETQAHWASLCVSSNTKAMCTLCKRKVIACCNL